MVVGSSNSNETNDDDDGVHKRLHNVVRASSSSLSSHPLFLHYPPSTDLYSKVTESACLGCLHSTLNETY